MQILQCGYGTWFFKVSCPCNYLWENRILESDSLLSQKVVDWRMQVSVHGNFFSDFGRIKGNWWGFSGAPEHRQWDQGASYNPRNKDWFYDQEVAIVMDPSKIPGSVVD